MCKVVVWCLAGFFLVPATARAQENQTQPQTLVQWHFTGTKNLEENKDLKTLRDILTQPESGALRAIAFDAFAKHAASHFTHTKATNADPATVELIKPLLPDLLQAESVFELQAQGAQKADWALAIKIPKDRRELWDSNLSQLVRKARLGEPGSAKIGGNSGWMVQGKEGYNLALSQNKDWLLLEGGFSPIDSHEKNFADFRKNMKKKLRKEVLTADFNFPLFGQIWGAKRFQHAPRIALEVTPKKGALRTEADLTYPQDLGIEPQKWNPPLNEILDPLIGFTAIQGIQKELQRSKLLPGLGLEKLPNQLFVWNRASSPFAVWVAADVGNPATVVSNINQTLVPMANKKIERMAIGDIHMLTNRTSIHWRGLPIVIPFLEPGARDNSFLVGGLFPMSESNPQPAPKALFEQLNQKNLVYYDWEITGARMGQYRPLWQLNYMLRNKVPDSTALSEKWIAATVPKLQNTVTQATLEKPDRLKVVRQSQTGFNALELVLLAHLLDPNDVQTLPETSATSATPNRQPGPARVPPRNSPSRPRK